MWPKKMALFNHWSKVIYHLGFSKELKISKTLVAVRGQPVHFQWRLIENVFDADLLDKIEVDMKDPEGSQLSLSIDGDLILKGRNVTEFGRGNKTPIVVPESDKILAFSACPIGDDGKVNVKDRVGYFYPNGSDIKISIDVAPGNGNVEIFVSLRMATYTTKSEFHKVETLP